MQQISQYAAAVATSAVTGQPIPENVTPAGAGTPTTADPTGSPAHPQPHPQPQPRVVFTRPTFTPPAPPPPFSGGTFHMRPGVPGQVRSRRRVITLLRTLERPYYTTFLVFIYILINDPYCAT